MFAQPTLRALATSSVDETHPTLQEPEALTHFCLERAFIVTLFLFGMKREDTRLYFLLYCSAMKAKGRGPEASLTKKRLFSYFEGTFIGSVTGVTGGVVDEKLHGFLQFYRCSLPPGNLNMKREEAVNVDLHAVQVGRGHRASHCRVAVPQRSPHMIRILILILKTNGKKNFVQEQLSFISVFLETKNATSVFLETENATRKLVLSYDGCTKSGVFSRNYRKIISLLPRAFRADEHGNNPFLKKHPLVIFKMV